MRVLGSMIVSLIAAVGLDGTIGHAGKLPWSIARDSQFFTDTTRGHVVITGRKNFEAMGGPLPQRSTIVLSRDPGYRAPGAKAVSDLVEALCLARNSGEREVFIIGGAELYAAAKPYAHRFYRTVVFAQVNGDVKYQDDDFNGWEVLTLFSGEKSTTNEHAFRVELWSRATPEKSYEAGCSDAEVAASSAS